MKALRFSRFGSLSELQLAEVPKPAAENDGVVVEILAASINPSDLKNVEGKMVLTLYGLDSRALDTVASASILRALAVGFKEGTLRAPAIAYQCSLENAIDAYRMVDSATVRGKVVIVNRNARHSS
jgi:threonine dehydrogenase-like Zn-dependent dehydrogenase